MKTDSQMITLSGKVDWDYQRRNAATAVRYLTGVKGITDDMAHAGARSNSRQVQTSRASIAGPIHTL